MARIYKSIEEMIGGTPLLQLGNYGKKHGLGANLLAKVEAINPGGSAKDRVAKRMVEDAGITICRIMENQDGRTHQEKYARGT